MASGTVTGRRYGGGSNGPWLSLHWDEIEQKINNNRTKLRLTLRFHWSGNINYTFYNRPGVLQGDSYTYSGSASGTSGSRVLHRTDVWIKHNSNGSKRVTLSGNIRSLGLRWSSVNVGTMTVSGAVDLTSIPRSSSLNSASLTSLQANSDATLSISRTVHYNGFYHLVSIFDGNTWIWDAGYSKGSPDTRYTIPSDNVNNMLNRMRDVTRKTFRVRLRTYSSSGGSGYIGESFQNITVSIHSNQAPTINDVSISDAEANIEKDLGVFVQGRSRLKVSMDVTPGYGARDKSFKITADGHTTTTKSLTTSEIKSSGNIRITLEYTNTRNQKVSTTRDVRVEPYAAPAIQTLDTERIDNQTQEEIENEVTRGLVRVRASISSLANNNENKFVLRYRPTGQPGWDQSLTISDSSYAIDETITLENIDENLAYDIELVAEDYFRESSLERTLAPVFSLMNFHESGRGLAFGGVAQKEEGIEYYLPVYFEEEVSFRSFPTTRLEQYTNLNETMEAGMYYTPSSSHAQSMENTPTDLSFSLLVERHAGVKQTLTTYKPDSFDVYIRNYHSGQWGNWRRMAFV